MAQNLRDLSLKLLHANDSLPAIRANPVLGAAIVRVFRPVAVRLVLGRDRGATLTASNQTRVGEGVPHLMRAVRAVQDVLNAVEFVFGDHGLVTAGVDAVFAHDEPVVEGIGEQRIEATLRKWSAPVVRERPCSKAPPFVRLL